MKLFIKKIFKKALFEFRFLILEIVENAKNEKLENDNKKILIGFRDKGIGIILNGEIKISHPLMCFFGNNVYIDSGSFFYTDGGLMIGDNTHISRNVVIYTSNHDYQGSKLPYDNNRIYKPVHIGANVWIGMNVCIYPGVTIGEGAIIGLGAVVSRDIPSFAIVDNSQQRIIQEGDEGYYAIANSLKSFEGVNRKELNVEINKKCKSIFELDDKLFFIVGTGRCGSESISKILDKHPDITCKHEPKGELIRISTEYAHGEITKEEAKASIISLYSSIRNISTAFYGESDQKISNLIPIYQELFPKAKFIWLLRECDSFVRSAYSRGWFDDMEFGYLRRKNISVKKIYPNKIYSIFRLNGCKTDSGISEQQWKEMTPIERNAWYWNYWNSLIELSFSDISEEQKIRLKIEDLENDIKKLNKYLKLPPFDFIVKKTNEAKYHLIDEINPADKKALDCFCSHKMTEWYGNDIVG